MEILISAFIGAFFGILAICLVMGGSNSEHEREAYQRGYEDGLKAGRKSEKQERL